MKRVLSGAASVAVGALCLVGCEALSGMFEGHLDINVDVTIHGAGAPSEVSNGGMVSTGGAAMAGAGVDGGFVVGGSGPDDAGSVTPDSGLGAGGSGGDPGSSSGGTLGSGGSQAGGSSSGGATETGSGGDGGSAGGLTNESGGANSAGSESAGGTVGESGGATSTEGGAGPSASGGASAGGQDGSGGSGSGGQSGSAATGGSAGMGAGGQPGEPEPVNPCPEPTPTRYVCPGGDDSGLGTEALPWATIERVRTAWGATIQAGQTIGLCRGATFTPGASRAWVNNRCTAEAPCSLVAYGDASLPAPVIAVSSGDAISLADGGAPDVEQGYQFIGIDVVGAGSGRGVFIQNIVNDVLFCDVRIEGFNLGIQVTASNAPSTLSRGIELRASRVLNNSSQGWLGTCNQCGIVDSYFENNGFGAATVGAALLNHNVYLDGHLPTSGMYIRGSEFTRSAVLLGAQCQGVQIVGHGRHDGLLIEDNFVHDANPGGNCWGIAIDPGYSAEFESFTNLAIRGNVVDGIGTVGIGTASCDACTIEDNDVTHNGSPGPVGIAVPNRSIGAEDAPNGLVTVRNNTITGACLTVAPPAINDGGNVCL